MRKVSAKLYTRRGEHQTQGVLTVAKEAESGVLDGGEGSVRLQEIGDDLGALVSQIVAAQTANERTNTVSRGIDACIRDAVLWRWLT